MVFIGIHFAMELERGWEGGYAKIHFGAIFVNSGGLG